MPKRASKILDGSGDLHVGIDAMHLPRDPDGVAGRALRQAKARRYLYEHGAADLVDVLGLRPDPDARRPGYCDCGRELTLTSARAPGGGRCYYCTLGVDAPQPAPAKDGRRKVYEQVLDPVTPPGAQPYPGAQAICVHCGRTYRLPASGRLRPHPGWVDKDGVETRLSTDCPGSGQYPAEVAGG